MQMVNIKLKTSRQTLKSDMDEQQLVSFMKSLEYAQHEKFVGCDHVITVPIKYRGGSIRKAFRYSQLKRITFEYN